MMDRPKALKRIRDSVVDKSRDTSEAARQIRKVSKGALEAALEQTQATSRNAVDKVFPECPVPVFMLPTGPSPEDYALVFRLDEILDDLKSGMAVRPKFEVLSARAVNYDPEHLGRELKQEFVGQFEAARESLVQAGEVALERLELKRSRASEELNKEVSGPTARSLGRWAASTVFALPLALILLGLGMKPRTEALRLLWDYRSVRADKRKTQRDLERELEELNSKFDSKSKAFQRAVRNIDIRTHPRIQTLGRLICEVEHVVFDPGDVEPGYSDVPDVQIDLHHPMYLKRLPELYRPLLDVV
jgi:hypothetical protein